jgi:hypothetical protein
VLLQGGDCAIFLSPLTLLVFHLNFDCFQDTKPAGCVMLLGSRVELVSDSEFDRPFSFALTENEASRRYIFTAADAKDRDEWVEALRACTTMRSAMSRINPSVLQTAIAQFQAEDKSKGAIVRRSSGATAPNTGLQLNSLLFVFVSSVLSCFRMQIRFPPPI